TSSPCPSSRCAGPAASSPRSRRPAPGAARPAPAPDSSSPPRSAPRSPPETAGSARSLHVLDLLAQALDLVLDADDLVLDHGVVRLRADRVRLPVHLLHQEAQPLADRLLAGLAEHLREQLHVRAEAHGLLAD